MSSYSRRRSSFIWRKTSFFYVLFIKTLKLDEGQALLRKYSSNAQKICSALIKEIKHSTKAEFNSDSLLDYIITSHFNVENGKKCPMLIFFTGSNKFDYIMKNLPNVFMMVISKCFYKIYLRMYQHLMLFVHRKISSSILVGKYWLTNNTQ